jgi:hypothetical protein
MDDPFGRTLTTVELADAIEQGLFNLIRRVGSDSDVRIVDRAGNTVALVCGPGGYDALYGEPAFDPDDVAMLRWQVTGDARPLTPVDDEPW